MRICLPTLSAHLSILCLLVLGSDVSAISQSLRTIALTGTTAPGTDTGTDFSTLRFPVINSLGQVAFVAALEGDAVSSSSDEGFWSEGPGQLQLIAREGEAVPGLDGDVKFGQFFTRAIALNANGSSAFVTWLAGDNVTAGNDKALWSDRSGQLAIVAREGQHAPGFPPDVKFTGATFSPVFHDFVMNSEDRIAFTSDVGNRYGIWSDVGGALALVAISNGEPVINSNGIVAVRGDLQGPGMVTSSGVSIWAGTSGNLEVLAQSFDPAPGFGHPVEIFAPQDPVINSSGDIAFRTSFLDRRTDIDQGILLWTNGQLGTVVRENDEAAGTESFYDEIFSDPVVNSAGEIAFWAALKPRLFGGEGIWSGRPGQLRLVARSGDQAPGTPPGTVFENLSTSANPFVLNSAGQVAFEATLSGDGVTFENNEGLWVEDRTGELRLVAREGDLLKIAPGEERIVGGFNFIGNSGNDDGRPSGFNDQGQVAFMAFFPDTPFRQGIFVSNVGTVPEPSSLLSFTCVACCFALTRCVRRWRKSITRRLTRGDGRG